ncbi:MAG: hypothetical protein U9O66_03280, partial [Patescibacteria group bacterium]|nr:hypothetical protein [Patescibacteria group bacterium]
MKFEFDKLKVIYSSDKILVKLNQKFDTGQDFTIEESVMFYRPGHALACLNFAGQTGWQIKEVVNKETKDGEIDIYYIQRQSDHPNFGKKTFREEYHESDLYKKHKKEIDGMTKRK